jgi:hypothetical protein
MKLKEKLQGHKTIRVQGGKYVIRKINPLLDFPYDKIPQIFTTIQSKRPVKEEDNLHPARLQKILDDMKSVVNAGLVDPPLVPVGKGENFRKEKGLTIDDIFMDSDLGTALYIEVLAHSLNRFKGLKGLFFSIRTKYLLYTLCRRGTNNDRLITYFQKAITQ